MTTWWNGKPCLAERCIVIVGDTGKFPTYWARSYVGDQRKAVEIHYNNEIFYIDDEDGRGWKKVIDENNMWKSHLNLEVQYVITYLKDT